jgi:hypothetical protein
MSTILKVQIVEGASPLANCQVTLGMGQPVLTSPTGWAVIPADGLYKADHDLGMGTLTIAPAGKKVVSIPIQFPAEGESEIQLDYGHILKEVSGKPDKKPLKAYGKSEWAQLLGVLGPILGILAAIGVCVWYYMTHTNEFTSHFMMLRTSGPEILGGLSTFVVVTMVINSVGALLRGERGMLEDFWSPILVVGIAIGSGPYIASRLTYVQTNMAGAPLETIFVEGGKAYGLVLFLAGIAAISMIRAITYQRMEKKLDTSPLNAALVVIGAFAFYNTFGFSLSAILWGVLIFVLTLGMLWELKRHPFAAFAGIGLGIVVGLVGTKTFTLVAFSAAALVVFGIGIAKFLKELDTKPQAPELMKLMETIPLEVLEYGWFMAFVVTVALAGFGLGG